MVDFVLLPLSYLLFHLWIYVPQIKNKTPGGAAPLMNKNCPACLSSFFYFNAQFCCIHFTCKNQFKHVKQFESDYGRQQGSKQYPNAVFSFLAMRNTTLCFDNWIKTNPHFYPYLNIKYYYTIFDLKHHKQRSTFLKLNT